MPVTNIERLFLQGMMTRRIVSETMAGELWKACVEAVRKYEPNVEAEQTFGHFISNINRLLEPLGLEVKGTAVENTGARARILVNNTGDEIAQLATAYNAVEITFFKHIVELIVMAPNESYSAGEITCLKEGNQLPGQMKVSLRHGTKLLGSFVTNGWLHKSKRSRYSLGPRTVVELRGYLTDTYEEENIQICPQCDGLVFKVGTIFTSPIRYLRTNAELHKGLRCTGNEGQCIAKVHTHCLDGLLIHRVPRCASCDTPWRNAQSMKVVGEGAVRDERHEGGRRREALESEDEAEQAVDHEAQGSRKGKGKSNGRGPRSSQRKRRRGNDDEEEEEAEALESEDEQNGGEIPVPMDEASSEEEAPKRRTRKR